MDAPIQHVPRPTSSKEAEESPSAFVIQRNTLTLYISFAAIILSCASAAVNLFTFYAGGQQKMVNEADQILTRAEANRVLQELTKNPNSHPVLNEELAKLYKDLRYHPPVDAKLTVYERMAFGLAVEMYSIPLTTVQMQVMKTLESVRSAPADMQEQSRMKCGQDPYADGCEALRQEFKEKAKQQEQQQ